MNVNLTHANIPIHLPEPKLVATKINCLPAAYFAP